ncbi:MAG: hypothetical protein L0332_29495 [Chloroflexi bacterium]|nr:hypothetical protein [Chloroflexota bacterium]MCI0575672.1 hypothetical protein [Chloroflexota bacterium]MCI0647525.1 hypothetical protein [Chloroflexota bacterium]MCI0730836.1 hypothetical protein [Chloroflexota bacterium]
MKLLAQLTTADRLIVGSMLLTLGGVILGAVLAEPNAFGLTAVLVILLLLAGWGITRDERLGWLLLAGLVGGVLELWADWVHVEYFHSLVYTDYFGFRLLASPSYMPVGWWLTVTQFGYLALRLADRRPAWQSAGLMTLLGMTLPPWYEEFAAPARAWYYTISGPMLSNTPLWIIFTYGGCMLAIATMALLLFRPRAWGRAILAGLFIGAGIMFSGVFWFALLG